MHKTHRKSAAALVAGHLSHGGFELGLRSIDRTQKALSMRTQLALTCQKLQLLPPGVRKVFAPIIALGLLLGSVAFASGQTAESQKEVLNFQKLGLGAKQVKEMDQWIEKAIRSGDFPGCVLCAGNEKGIQLLKAYGNRQVLPSKKPMKVDTIFDLASLTKPLATGLAIMHLKQQGKIQLKQSASEIIPEFGSKGKTVVNLVDLLTHQSGLIPDNAMRDYLNGPEEAWKKIYALPLRYGHRKKFKYSDVGFQVLGKIVEKKSNLPLDQYTKKHLYDPLNLKDTGFLPSKEKLDRMAPSDKRNGKWILGEVHDPRSYRLGGVAGHAGLFSTAPDLAVIAQCLLNGGSHQGKSLLNSKTVKQMTEAIEVPGGSTRGLGWDKDSPYSSNRGSGFSQQAIGHGGFTGTVFWVDPGKKVFFILLSNRLHPDGKGQVNRLAGRIATMIGQAAGK